MKWTVLKDFANYIGTNYCVGLGNCLDALWLSFRVLGIGATWRRGHCSGQHLYCQRHFMGITINDATPVLWSRTLFIVLMLIKLKKK